MSETDKEAPWWWPKIVDAAYLERLRNDYPDKAGWSDENLADYFEVEIGQFSDTWDHLGDARDEYREVAKHMLHLQARVAELEEKLKIIANWKADCHAYDSENGHELRVFDHDDVSALTILARQALKENQDG